MGSVREIPNGMQVWKWVSNFWRTLAYLLTENIIVQYLLVQGQYLQGTQKSVQAWTTHGLAISAAFQLGLHSPEANRRFSPVESEIRKRTWFGCILLDR